MNLFFLSLLALFGNIFLHNFKFGFFIDLISPLLVAVALTRSYKKTFWWSLIMAFLWAPFINVNPINLAITWMALTALVKFSIRGLDWENSNVVATIAIITSSLWQLALVLVEFLTVGSVSNDPFFWGAVAIRPLSAAIIVVFFYSLLFVPKRFFN